MLDKSAHFPVAQFSMIFIPTQCDSVLSSLSSQYSTLTQKKMQSFGTFLHYHNMCTCFLIDLTMYPSFHSHTKKCMACLLPVHLIPFINKGMLGTSFIQWPGWAWPSVPKNMRAVCPLSLSLLSHLAAGFCSCFPVRVDDFDL